MKNKTIPSIALAMALLAACSEPERDPLDVVPERAQARWNHLIEREFSEAFAFYSPGFRETMDERDFAWEMNRRPVRWLEAEVREVECLSERCTVRTNVRYHVPSAPAGLSRVRTNRVVEETWIRVDGQWWYLPD